MVRFGLVLIVADTGTTNCAITAITYDRLYRDMSAGQWLQSASPHTQVCHTTMATTMTIARQFVVAGTTVLVQFDWSIVCCCYSFDTFFGMIGGECEVDSSKDLILR